MRSHRPTLYMFKSISKNKMLVNCWTMRVFRMKYPSWKWTK
jgi:hypothetical protein